MFRLAQAGIKLLIDGCFLEEEWKDFVRMNAKDQKVFILNSILRNGGDITDASDNQWIDTRGLDQDSIFIQNSTMYVSTGRGFRSGGAFFRNFILDHSTFYQMANGSGQRGYTDTTSTPIFDVTMAQNVTVTNNLFIDMAFTGDEINSYTGIIDTLDYPLFGFKSLVPVNKQDDTRKITIKNNVIGNSAAMLSYYHTQNDTLKPAVLLNEYSINKYFNKYPNTWVQKDNITETVNFKDAPDQVAIYSYTNYRRTNGFTEVGCPEFWADRNGIGGDPSNWGPAEKEYDFSYANTFSAYYAAEKRFPAGDLNWFPALKALWASGGTVDVEIQDGILPTEYSLEQNYPNPFNPVTTISYSLPKASIVTVTIYNLLGQKMEILENNKFQEAGSYKIKWDAGKYSSGMYLYQLQSDNVLISKKMILIK
ncbi:MAG: T9SS type A sorting domain-containing protein, partial [Melioribacteraceae bacterium]